MAGQVQVWKARRVTEHTRPLPPHAAAEVDATIVPIEGLLDLDVLDLSEDLHTNAYTPTARQREQVILTCPTCVFPGCGKTAQRCDLDHITPWHQGGRTESTNVSSR